MFKSIRNILIIVIVSVIGFYAYNGYSNLHKNEDTQPIPATENSSTIAIEDSIKTLTNNICEYKVSSGEMKIAHSYEHRENDVIITKVGTGNFKYDFIIESLKTIEVEDKDNNLYVYVDYPVLDKDSIACTEINIDEEKSSINLAGKICVSAQSLFKNKTAESRATEGFSKSIKNKSLSEINKMHLKDEERVKKLEKDTKDSVRELIITILNKIDTDKKYNNIIVSFK